MEKLFAFVMFCLYILGSIGGFGFAVYGGSWLIAVCVAIFGVMAFPKAEKWFK